MVLRANLKIRHHGCLTERIVNDLSLLQISGERGWDVFVLRAAGPARLSEGLAITESNGEKAEILARTEECIVFKGRNPPGGIIDAIRSSPCWIQWPIIYRDGVEHFSIGAPSRKALRELHGRLLQLGDVRVERIVEDPRDVTDLNLHVADLVSDLTPKQLNIMLHAIRNGYYQNPKEITSEELARQIGIAPSTLREHMRKAESTLLAAVASIVAEDPDAARRANKRRGRPPSKLGGPGDA